MGDAVAGPMSLAQDDRRPMLDLGTLAGLHAHQHELRADVTADSSVEAVGAVHRTEDEGG